MIKNSKMLIEFQDIIKDWDADKNSELDANKLTYGSQKEVWWKCENGHEWLAQIKSRTTQGNGCRQCRYKVNPQPSK